MRGQRLQPGQHAMSIVRQVVGRPPTGCGGGGLVSDCGEDDLAAAPSTTPPASTAPDMPPPCPTCSTASSAVSTTACEPARYTTKPWHSQHSPQHQNPLQLDSWQDRRSVDQEWCAAGRRMGLSLQ